MLRHLLHIVWNERNANLLIGLELLVVSLSLVYLADYAVTKGYIYTRPMGLNIDNVAYIRLKSLWPSHPRYRADDTTDWRDKIPALLQRIENHPAVEAVCYGRCAFPYQGNSETISLFFQEKEAPEDVFFRTISPSFVDVFRLESTFSTREELKQALAAGYYVPSTGAASLFQISPKELLDQKMACRGYRDTVEFTVKEMVNEVRMNEIALEGPSIFAYSAAKLDYFLEKYPNSLMYGFRLKDGAQITPHELYLEMRDQLQAGNWVCDGFVPICELKERRQEDFFNELKLNGLYMTFLFLSIFLGVVGTFWYRAQQRRSQIGLRISMGATPRQVLGLYLSEGVLLLLSTLPFTVVGYGVLSSYGILSDVAVHFISRAPLAFLLAYGVLALLILLAIWIPTRLVVRVSPSQSMRDE